MREQREKRIWSRRRAVFSVDELVRSLIQQKGGEQRLHLNALWENWAHVMGEELAEQAFPLGQKKGVLFIGAEDAMALQELFMQSPEILERVNVFMDSPFFQNIRVELLQGRKPLTEHRRGAFSESSSSSPLSFPDPVGTLLGKLDPASPFTRYYEQYVFSMRKKKENDLC